MPTHEEIRALLAAIDPTQDRTLMLQGGQYVPISSCATVMADWRNGKPVNLTRQRTLTPEELLRQRDQLARRLRHQGWSLLRVAAELAAHGFTGNNGKPLTEATISRILSRG